MSIIKDLQWRYAVKRMTGAKVSEEKIQELLEAIRWSASGFGLQPYQVLVVEDPSLREKIQGVAYGQPQVVESSHLLIFAAWNEITAEKIQHFIQLVAKTRNAPLEALSDYHNAISGALLSRPVEQQVAWADKQAYLAMGTALVAAAELRLDTTPMEGFNPKALDELLNLSEKGLHSVLMLAVGQRDEAADYMTGMAKVRYPMSDFVQHLG